MIIQMNAAEQYFPVVLFITLFKVVQTFESLDEILKCTRYFLTFAFVDEIPYFPCNKPDYQLFR